DIPIDAFVAAGRGMVNTAPLTWAELRERLAARWPCHSATALLRAVQFTLPLVQVPPRGLWQRSGAARVTTADTWLGQPFPKKPSREGLGLRFPAPFGPASVMDMQAWSGLTKLGAVAARLRPQLATFADEDGRELFDLPEAPRPDEDIPAPVR